MKYRRRLPAILAGESGGSDSDEDAPGPSLRKRELYDDTQSEIGDLPSSSSSRFSRGKAKSFREGGGGKETSSADGDARRVYVSNVSYRVTTSQLASFFSKFGKVSGCSIPVDKMGTFPRHGGRPKSKGVAYVSFRSEDGVAKAKAARPEELKFYDRVMVVSQALPTPRKSRPNSSSSFTSAVGASLDGPLAPISAGPEDDTASVSASDSESTPATTPATGVSIHCLSDELLAKVVGRLDLEDRVRVERVSKKWLEVAYRSWTEERRIAFAEKRFQVMGGGVERKPLGDPVLLAVLRRSGHGLHSLDLSNCPHFLDPDTLPLIGAHCPGLTNVNFTGLKVNWQALKLFAESSPNLRSIVYRDAAGLGEKAFWYLFRNCKNLERVDLAGCRRLQGRCFKLLGLFLDQVRLSGCAGLEPEAVEEMSLKSPHLTQLFLDDCSRLSDQSIALIARSMSSLKVLSLCGPGLVELSSSGLAQLGLIESLEEVRLAGNGAVTDEVVESIAQGCLGLRRLCLAHAGTADSISEVGLTSLSGCSELEELDLSGLAGAGDSVLVLGLAGLAKLTVLRLRACRNISDKGVGGLLRGCKELEELDLSGCLRVTEAGVKSVIARYPVAKQPDSGLDLPPVSVVIGGTGCIGAGSLGTRGSRVVLDTADYSASQVAFPLKGNNSARGGPSGAEGNFSDDDAEDDEFESLTASRSFVLERLEEDDLVLDESRIAEWQAQFRALSAPSPASTSARI